jgi:hypothetical protein
MNQAKIVEVRDVCFAKGWKDKSGQEKTHWTKVGVLFIKDNGGMSIVLDAMPIGTNQLVAFKKKPREGGAMNTPVYQPDGATNIPSIDVDADMQAPPAVEGDGEIRAEDIPF